MEEAPPEPEILVQFPKIAAEIDAMAVADQDMREKSLKEDFWDDSIDAKNTARMKEIVTQIGWPTVSKVGKGSSVHAWLLVQHADHDVKFQDKCLALMKQEPSSEIDSRNIAMLEDRVRVNRHQHQIYGTQFRQIDGQHTPLPIEDESNVNERRKQMGLDSLEENIAEMYKNYGPPNQG